MQTAPAAVSSLVDGLDADDRRFGWHPFTQMQEYGANPRLHLVRGEGCWLIDAAGNRYLDGNASVWTNVHGHNDVDLNRALREQAEQVAHVTMLGLNHRVATELAADLAVLTHGALPRCFYTDNGSNAIEVALKLSFQYWQLVGQPAKQGVLSMSGAYHGDTFGTMSVGERSEFHRRFTPWLFDAQTFRAPTHSECAGQVVRSSATTSLAELDALLAKVATTTACLILEPRVQGAAGMVQQPAGFVPAVAALCKKHDIHLILDEVFTGFGRLGALTAAESEAVVPDFLCLAKGLAAGYLPLAATLTSEKIYATFLGEFSEGRTFFHGHTFSGNPLACAVARESLRKLKPMLASGQVAERAALLGTELARAFAGQANVAEVRQFGLTGAVDFLPAPGCHWDVDTRAGYKVALAARKHGLVIRPLRNSILFVPPIAIAAAEVKHLVAAVRLAAEEVLPNLKTD